MEDKKLEEFKMYAEVLDRDDKEKLLSEYMEYTASVQRAVQFSTIHAVEFRNLATFLLVFSVSMFFSFDVNSTVLFWMILMLLFTIVSKLAQIGSTVEMKRFKERLDGSLREALRRQKEKDV